LAGDDSCPEFPSLGKLTQPAKIAYGDWEGASGEKREGRSIWANHEKLLEMQC
jgi:hypothetical protein